MQLDQKIYPPLNHIPADIVRANDYERVAANFIPPDRLAYVDGGSGHNVTLRANVDAFTKYSIIPRSLKDLSEAHTQIQLLSQTYNHPIFLAPVAHQKLVHPRAEIATAEAAAATDTCIVASTLSSFSLEDIARNTHSQSWFQLYFQAKEADTHALLQRAIRAGYQAIVLTIDASIQVPSDSALKANFTFPDDMQAANIIHQSSSLTPAAASTNHKSIFLRYMQTAATKERVQKLLSVSTIPVFIKGVMSDEDALLYQSLGAAGMIVSNHGGRTLDGVPACLTVLSQLRNAVGKDYPLLFDSGIRSGADIFKAIALGADAVLIGRLQVYALSVAGALGVAHMMKLLKEELALCMAIAGCASIEDIKHSKLHRNTERQ